MSAMVRSNLGSGTGEARQFPIPEIGNYNWKFINVSEPYAETRTFNGKEKEVTRIYLDWEPQGEVEWIADDDVEIRDHEFVRTYFNLTLGSKEKPSNLRPYMEALLGTHGEILDDEQEYDINDYVGTKINASVKHYSKKNGTLGADLTGPIAIKPKGGNGTRRRVATPSSVSQEPEAPVEKFDFQKISRRQDIQSEPEEASADGPGWD